MGIEPSKPNAPTAPAGGNIENRQAPAQPQKPSGETEISIMTQDETEISKALKESNDNGTKGLVFNVST